MPATLVLEPQVTQKTKQPYDYDERPVHNSIPPECVPDYEKFVTEDDAPVDSIFSEKEMRLLVDSLYDSWQKMGQTRPFAAFANVGLFYDDNEPAIEPDMFLSLDVTMPKNIMLKKNRSYFVWNYGKPPDVVVEIVSNRKGKEDTSKIQTYEVIGIDYYIIHDPLKHLKKGALRVYELQGDGYKLINTNWLTRVELGITLWQGKFQDMEATWLRWCNKYGQMFLTGRQWAEQADMRAEQLAAKLLALGIDPTRL